MGIKYKSHKLINSMRAMNDMLFRRGRVHASPVHIHLEINDICNLKCFMCPREALPGAKDTGNMSMDVVKALGPYMSNATHVGLIGNGEPFIHPQIMDVVEFIVSKGATPSIINNGTLIKQHHIDGLVSMGPTLLFFSIDGGTKETFEKIRINAKFEKVVDNLMAVAEKKKSTGAPYPVLGFIVCLMKENVHELNEIVELAARAGVAHVIVQKLFPYVEQLHENALTDEELCRRKVAEATQLAERHGIQLKYHEMNVPLAQSMRGQNNGNGHRKVFYCENAWQQMHVMMNGDVRTCCFWTKGNSGNVLESDPMEVWNNAGIRRPREQMLKGEIPEDCQTCHLLQYHHRGMLARSQMNQLAEIWRQ